MGREIRRVALDFDWQLGKVWAGFLNPYCGGKKCDHCQVGYNVETQKIYDSFYDTNNYNITWTYKRDVNGRACGVIGTTVRWCNKLTQDEVDALIAEERVPAGYTAELINEGDYNHDAINMNILVRVRATRLGVWGMCEKCDGHRWIWNSKAEKYLSESFEKIDPPAGEGWQVWETVSEGSPITPVLPTAEALIDHLVNHGTSWRKDGYTRRQAEAFVKSGWVPSAIFVSDGNGTTAYRDIESATLQEN